ncbi:Cyclin N-terminal domain-containing protein [Heracleum sosnowskyi]|uniref:Cyclin N-terminal domain-containing protein n=1 Tax=Heracleum sosnowskyi TaxID=360622 RepID=A0AAD8IVJ1_9APIA|nr:Cyclin N-terminal domain-containing protein [Heracleum sosnowskyi]
MSLPTSFHLDSLYCQEPHFDEDIYQTDGEHEQVLELNDHFDEENEDGLASLFLKEDSNVVCDDFVNNPFLVESRRDAVEWMLRVVGFYSFSSLTAVLAVNYFDRFVKRFEFSRDKVWMIQLVSVTCLSIAAKMEEVDVPLLLDFQVEEPAYVFEAKTIQRMEVLVLSTLEWKMNPVTPLSFLDCITNRLGLKSYIGWEFHKNCESLVLSIVADCRFMCYLPSVIATATMLLVIRNVEPCNGIDYQTELLGILGIDKCKLEDCCKLIQELVSEGYGSNINKRKFGSFPGSPRGVMDLCFSQESSNHSWAVTTSAPTSVSSSPEPASKKRKAQDQNQPSFDNAAADNLSIPL